LERLERAEVERKEEVKEQQQRSGNISKNFCFEGREVFFGNMIAFSCLNDLSFLGPSQPLITK